MENFVILTDSNGTLLTGKSAYTALRIRRSADGYLLDWHDLTFKNAAWTDVYTTLTEIDSINLPGSYNKSVVTTDWVDGYYQSVLHFDDGSTVDNFESEVYLDSGVVAIPTTVDPSGVGGDTLRAMIATHLNRTDLTSQIATFCELAVNELEENCLWFQLTSATVNTVVSQKYASLPTGFLKEVNDGFKDTSGIPLTKKDWATINYWQTRNAGTGEPDYYAIADKFYFYSIPDAIYALSLQYYQRLGFPAAGYDNAWTTTAWDATFWAALKHAWLYLGNTTNSVKCELELIKCLNRYRSRSGKITGKGTITYREF